MATNVATRYRDCNIPDFGEHRDLVTATTGRDGLLEMKMAKPGKSSATTRATKVRSRGRRCVHSSEHRDLRLGDTYLLRIRPEGWELIEPNDSVDSIRILTAVLKLNFVSNASESPSSASRVGPPGSVLKTRLAIILPRKAHSTLSNVNTHSLPQHCLYSPVLTGRGKNHIAIDPNSLYFATLINCIIFFKRKTLTLMGLNQNKLELINLLREPMGLLLLWNDRLTHLADTRLAHGLSGGERRRVSIGLSLLHDPAVLLLDEPTSGLDSGSAFNVMQTLKSIAVSRNRTVVLSIHQPSFKILSTIDRILMLSKGTVVHHGTLSSLEAFLLSNGFTVPPQLNALEYTMEILSQLHEYNTTTKSITTPPPSSSASDLSPSPPRDDQSPPPSLINDVNESKVHYNIRYRSSRLQEIFSLYNRFWKIIFRTRQFLLTNTLEALVVGLVLGTIYINIGYDKQGIEKRFGLFAFTLTFLLSSTTETLPIFINERPIILREASSGVYRLSSYLIANTLVFMPYLLAVAIIYTVSVYFLVGLCASWQAFAYFVLVIWIVVLMANSFVLFLSSLAPNYIAGTSLVTILLGGFFLFSGYFITQESLPKYWLFMHFLSMYKYALDALLINEYSCLVSRCLIWYDESNNTCMVTGEDVLQKRGLHEKQRWTNIYFLIAFFVFYRLLCFMVLIRRVSKSKK
ncbi:hypothetical protein JRO89_XS11G0207200 [Xanthoceras sorbifolium]|uniref:ABC transporter domain-containing protein n=1 Tax=Xanthoceras sorbifolium TaxID=99658 RepID=A0ABQ8HGJ5_9ROSI|nr:hypothetical protein JRO89_XS11G0207200 [Xanthoceras sorbifolium]